MLSGGRVGGGRVDGGGRMGGVLCLCVWFFFRWP